MGRPVARRGEGKSRVIDAALALFAVHGVNGTSLQMIADELGVTKAAVYHQFNSKADIVLAVAAPALAQLEKLVTEVEGKPAGRHRSEAAIEGLVDLVLDHRSFSASMQRDPGVARVLAENSSFTAVTARIDAALLGADASPEARVALALAGGGLLVSAVNPLVENQPRDILKRVFIDTTVRALEPYLD